MNAIVSEFYLLLCSSSHAIPPIVTFIKLLTTLQYLRIYC
jgi:hypothetical protein